jgi:hypothetical protein
MKRALVRRGDRVLIAGQAHGHDDDGGSADHGLGVRGGALVVTGQPAAAHQPGTGDSCREGRLFAGLSAKPDLCNPLTAGTPNAGSQKGSQRRQAVTDIGRRSATISAGRRLIRRRPATVHDGRIAPEKRKVDSSILSLTTKPL